MPSCYWFTYPIPDRDMRVRGATHVIDIHRVRDGCAAMRLISIAMQAGFEYGGEILNLSEHAPGSPRRFCAPELTGDDLVVVATRPPLNDDHEGAPDRSMRASRTALETDLFTSLDDVFSFIDRSRVFLTASLIAKLPEHARRYGESHFGINRTKLGQGIAVIQMGEEEPNDVFSIGYLAVVRSTQQGGPRFLVAFGIGGLATHVWSKIVSRMLAPRIREVLDHNEARMLMARFVPPVTIPYPFPEFTEQELGVQHLADVAL